MIPWPFVCVAILILLMVSFGLSRDRRRGQAFAVVGAGLGLRYERWGQGLREELSALPAMQQPGRHVFAHSLRSENEILADWRIMTRPKQRPRRVTQTLVAFRQPGVSREATRIERRDDSPSGFGHVVLEAGGEWVSCYSLNRRLPIDSLLRFREMAAGWAQEIDES